MPLWFGGKHDLGRFLYAAAVAGATLAWAARCWLRREPFARWSSSHVVLGIAVALVGLQLVPWGTAVLGHLSPALANLAPAWVPGGDTSLSLGEWKTLSVTPSATRIGLAVLLAHALFFVVVSERVRDLRDVNRALNSVAVAATGMAVLGLLQWVTSSDRLLWFYPAPWREADSVVRGAFTNRNHFAHFVVLGVGPIIAALLAPRPPSRASRGGSRRSNRRETQRLLWLAALVVSIVAVVLTMSRGGFLALLAAGVAAGVVLLRSGRVRPAHAMGVVGVVAASVLIVSFGDTARVFGRLDDLASGSADELDRTGSRRAIWSANVAALRASPWFGYGVGSHADVYPAFIDTPLDLEYTHAESGYLHTTTQTGLAGGALLVVALALCASWCLRGVVAESDPDKLVAWAAIVAGLVASVLHSAVDVVWYVPSCLCATLVLAACAMRLSRSATAVSPNDSYRAAQAWSPATGVRAGLAVSAAVVAGAILWGPARASLAWDRYLRDSVYARDLVASWSMRVTPEEAQQVNETVDYFNRRMIDSLEEVIRHHPGHARAHLRLAARKLHALERTQADDPDSFGVHHLRDAALASRFPTREATVAWLRAALGEDAAMLDDAHRHAFLALRLAPLQGDGYGYLADLSFLSPPAARDVDGLMRHALAIRPLDGGVVFEAGKQALLAGDADRALELWKRAHRIPGSHQRRIILQLAGQMPAAEYLREFEPDWKALVAVKQRYDLTNDSDDLRAIGEHAKRLAGSPADGPRAVARSANAWRMASHIERQLDDVEQGVRCAEQALALLPMDYPTRLCVASAYLDAGRHEDAAPHFRWCLSRHPHDRTVQDGLKEATRRRLAAAAEAELRSR